VTPRQVELHTTRYKQLHNDPRATAFLKLERIYDPGTRSLGLLSPGSTAIHRCGFDLGSAIG